MRLFLIQWGNPNFPELTDVIRDLQNESHEIVYWLASQDLIHAIKKEFPGTIFHDYYDAVSGQPASGVDDSDFPPPGAELIKKLSEYESILLTMMNKLYRDWPVSERKNFYYRLLRYWRGVFRKYKPDAVVFPLPPHAAPDFVIYALAKLLNIKTVMFIVMQDTYRVLPMNDFKEGNLDLKKAISAKQNNIFFLNDLSDRLRDYYKKHSENLNGAIPEALRNLEKKHGMNLIEVLIRSIRDFTLPQMAVNFIFKRFFDVNIRREYASIESLPDFSKKFIYFPLQYQPEMTTSPVADIFVDHQLSIEILSAALPKDWLIYVKEHPRQFVQLGYNFSQYRYRGYYKNLARFKNVRIVPVGTDSFKLINASQAVAIATCTAGLEAVLRGRPVIIFGYTWFRDCPGMFPVDDFDSCRQAISLIRNGYQVDRQRLINYFAYYDKFSFQGCMEDHLKPFMTISSEENKQNFLFALRKYLNSETGV